MSTLHLLLVAASLLLISIVLTPLSTRIGMPERLWPRQFFGDFTLSGSARLADLEQVYGLEIDAGQRQLSLSKVIGAATTATRWWATR